VTPRILRVALTGGIATGKSYCLTRFAERGARTIDADVIAHRALAPGTTGLAAVVARFGQDVLQPHGELDRARLGRIVFEDAQARRDLEAITHPAVYGTITDWFASLDQAPPAPPLGIADIPLLYETGHDRDFDRVIVVFCPPGVQLARLMKRNALSEDDAKRRIAAQMPIEEKARRGDFVVETSGAFADTDRQIEDVWTALKSV
jgi:dephospho-CoA kinase